jgi:hypothetical protein
VARGKDSGRTTIAIATIYKREPHDADGEIVRETKLGSYLKIQGFVEDEI